MDNAPYTGLVKAADALAANPDDPKTQRHFATVLSALKRQRHGKRTVVSLNLHALTPPCTREDVWALDAPLADWSDATARFAMVSQTPSVPICRASWLEALLFDDRARHVPPVAERVVELCRDFPVVTPELTDALLDALALANPTVYAVADAGDVGAFLLQHQGEPLFTVSW